MRLFFISIYGCVKPLVRGGFTQLLFYEGHLPPARVEAAPRVADRSGFTRVQSIQQL